MQLFILTQGRYVKPDEYEQLSSAFPGKPKPSESIQPTLTRVGTSTGSIRNRISALRAKQRDLYEELGWTLPEGGATKKGAGTTPAKRKKTDDEGEETPSKKARGKKKTAAAKSEDEEGEGSGGEIKEEQVEDDV
jgi:hypothetical protein